MALDQVNPRAAEVGENIFRQLRDRLRESWEEFDGEDVELIQQCAADAGVLVVAAMTIAPDNAEAQARLRENKKDINAQFLNLQSAEAQRVAAEFWGVVRTVLNVGVAIAFAAV